MRTLHPFLQRMSLEELNRAHMEALVRFIDPMARCSDAMFADFERQAIEAEIEARVRDKLREAGFKPEHMTRDPRPIGTVHARTFQETT